MLSIIFSTGAFNLYTFGFLMAIGVFLEIFIIWRRLKELGLKEERVLDFLMVSLLLGLLFSRALFIIQNFHNFGWLPLRWVGFIRFPGFSFWGWVLGLIVSLSWFAKKEKWEFWRVADETVFGILPFLILFQIGSFLDGSGFGRTTNMPWGMYFPGTLLKRHPLSLFSALFLFAIWYFLLKVERHWRTWDWYKNKQGGFVTLSGLGLIFLTHLLLAFLRDSGVYFYWLGVGLTVIGLAITVVFFFINSGRSFAKNFLKKKSL
jgi:phosphatidylglycerol:prolipoprotein diacylglycerol transferase